MVYFEAASPACSAQMRSVAIDAARRVVSVSVCVLGTHVSCAKTAEPIEICCLGGRLVCVQGTTIRL